MEEILLRLGLLDSYRARLSQAETKFGEIQAQQGRWKTNFEDQSKTTDIPHPFFLDELNKMVSIIFQLQFIVLTIPIDLADLSPQRRTKA